MKVKLLLGIVLFVIGIATAVIGIVGVGATPQPVGPGVEREGVAAATDTAQRVAIPVIAGLSLGVGGLLIGLSMGNWRHPRTRLEPGDEVVNPEGYHKMKHV